MFKNALQRGKHFPEQLWCLNFPLRLQSTKAFEKAQPALFRQSKEETLTMPPSEFSPPVYEGPKYSWLCETRNRLINPALKTHYRDPLLIHAGHMQWLYDQSGKRYLDLFAGIVTVSLGHCHPKVNEAAVEQMRKLWHITNIYLHPKIHEYAHRLVEKLPGELKVVYFVNSGSEANDLAMMMARLYTGAFDIITLQNSYHGGSPYTIGLSGESSWKHSFANSFGIYHAPNPDPHRGIWGGHRDSPVQSLRANESTEQDGVCSSSDKYVNQLRDVLYSSVGAARPAAFFAESIQGFGGATQYSKGYLQKAFQLIREHGGVCVSDEVQTGFGRTGEHFWGFEGHGVIPDIVTMAKGIGNGFPLGAVVTTPAIAETMNKGRHFNTFGGNPLGCAIGISVLDVIEEEKTQEKCLDLGTYFLKELEKLRNEYEIVGDVRGKGLMIGVEMVENKESGIPLNAEVMMDIWEDCKNMGVILGRSGRHSNIFRIKPPMCITKDDITFAINVLKRTLDKRSLGSDPH